MQARLSLMPTSPSPAVLEADLAGSGLYVQDVYSWAVHQAAALRRRDAGALDWDHVAEEIEDFGNHIKHGWTSYCANVIEHLLKIEHCEQDDDLAHWQKEIQTWRWEMSKLMRKNPGLAGQYSDLFADAWNDGRRQAARSIAEWHVDRAEIKAWKKALRGVDELLPKECPYRLLEVTAYDSKRPDLDVRDEIMPPSVASVLNERSHGGYPVRSWTGLDDKIQAGSGWSG